MNIQAYADLIARISSGMTTSDDAQMVADLLTKLELLEERNTMSDSIRAIDELMQRIEEADY
jgi:hypothetical protein